MCSLAAEYTCTGAINEAEESLIMCSSSQKPDIYEPGCSTHKLIEFPCTRDVSIKSMSHPLEMERVYLLLVTLIKLHVRP